MDSDEELIKEWFELVRTDVTKLTKEERDEWIRRFAINSMERNKFIFDRLAEI